MSTVRFSAKIPVIKFAGAVVLYTERLSSKFPKHWWFWLYTSSWSDRLAGFERNLLETSFVCCSISFAWTSLYVSANHHWNHLGEILWQVFPLNSKQDTGGAECHEPYKTVASSLGEDPWGSWRRPRTTRLLKPNDTLLKLLFDDDTVVCAVLTAEPQRILKIFCIDFTELRLEIAI